MDNQDVSKSFDRTLWEHPVLKNVVHERIFPLLPIGDLLGSVRFVSFEWAEAVREYFTGIKTISLTSTHSDRNQVKGHEINYLSRVCSRLESLSFCHVNAIRGDNLPSGSLERFFRNNSATLTRLDLTACSCMDNEAILAVVPLLGSLSRLVTFIIDGNPWLTNGTIRSLIAHCPQGIQRLSLTSCWSLTDPCLVLIGLRLSSSLRHLNLSSIFGISDRGLIALVQHCPHLVTIDLTNCWKVTDLTIEALVRHCHLLSLVAIGGTAVGAEGRHTLLIRRIAFMTTTPSGKSDRVPHPQEMVNDSGLELSRTQCELHNYHDTKLLVHLT